MQILIWTGQKHSGKSTAAGELVAHLQDAGVTCGGLLAPSLYENGELCGFDALDVASGVREKLLHRVKTGQEAHVGNFAFCDLGVRVAKEALVRPLDGGIDFVLVDEFGTLELAGKGWRSQIDQLIRLDAVLMLVVREELTTQVAKIYSCRAGDVLLASDPNSIEKIVDACKNMQRRKV
jgi:nucleoside-triphosphatase THEP1